MQRKTLIRTVKTGHSIPRNIRRLNGPPSPVVRIRPGPIGFATGVKPSSPVRPSLLSGGGAHTIYQRGSELVAFTPPNDRRIGCKRYLVDQAHVVSRRQAYPVYMMSRISRGLSRAKYAAVFAAIGAAVGGLFGRRTASSGAAVGGLIGAAIGERRASPVSMSKQVKDEVTDRVPKARP